MIDIAVTPLDDPAALLGDWAALYPHTDAQDFFLSPPWIAAWLEGAPAGAQLLRVEAMADQAPVLLGVVAAAPQYPPLLGLREARLHEFGEAARDAVYIEYNDFLVARDAPKDARSAALAKLFEALPHLDGFVLRNLRGGAASAAHAAASEAGLSVRMLREQPVYSCALSRGDILETLSKSLQTKLRRAIRLYEERGPLTACVAISENAFDAAWEKLTILHKAGWAARGQASVFDNPHLAAFHARLRKNTPESLHLFEVRAGDETIAVLYNFVHGKRVMNYQAGFRFEDDNRLTPGFVAHLLAARHYREAGFDTYDLLAGEADYKQRLGAIETTLTSLVIERPSWRNRLRRLLRG